MTSLDVKKANLSDRLEKDFISIVVPAFNESENILVLYERVRNTLGKMEVDWEIVIVDDHSADNTFEIIKNTASKDPNVHGVRLAKNSGSDMAMMCGFRASRGDCAITLAADLQDPPELIPSLVAQWKEGAQVVGAVRAGREGVSMTYKIFAKLFYLMMRKVFGVKETPEDGAVDFFLLDRSVLEALARFKEGNMSLGFLIPWLGFKQKYITYIKEARLHGTTSWTLPKIAKRIVDSISFFSFMPIRAISFIGMLVALLGFAYAVVVITLALKGVSVSGWASLMVVVLVLGGTQMLMMGTLGEYLWRALEAARGRPQYLVEEKTQNLDRLL